MASLAHQGDYQQQRGDQLQDILSADHVQCDCPSQQMLFHVVNQVT